MMDKAKILIVEDDPNDIELMITALAASNLDSSVVVARNGVDALEYLRRSGDHAGRLPGNPAVVVLDLKIPKINGLEVLREIKSDDKLKLIPVVVISSSDSQKDIKQCYESGANAYVVKPVDFFSFVARVKNIALFWGLTNETI